MDRKTKKLVEQLQSKSAKERYVAVLELGRTGDTELIPHIDKVATLDANPKVRKLASQAVRALNVIKQRENEEARQAQIAALDAEEEALEIEPGAFGWGSIDDLIVEKEPKEDSEEWNYHQLGKKHQEERTAREADEAEQQKRRRWRYRRFLWISTIIVVAGLALTAYYRLYIYDRPESRENALDRLQEWTDDLSSTTQNYLAFLNDPATEPNCADFTDNDDYVVPETPDWAGPDEPYQEDLETFFESVEQVQTELNDIRTAIESFCDDQEGTQVWQTEKMNLAQRISQGGVASNIDLANRVLDSARIALENDEGESADSPSSE